MSFSIKSEFRDFKRLNRRVKSQYPNIYKPALSGALNKTAVTVRAEGARKISKEMGSIRISKIKQDMKKYNATRNRLTAYIEAKGSPLSLKEFKPKSHIKRGVTHRAWGKKRVIKGAFVGAGGHVFVRKTKEALPLKKLWGPGIARTMAQDNVSQHMIKTAGQRLPINLQREINWRAKKYK